MMSENNENGIREAFDRIEPAEGAKERMLQNIRRKAEAANATKTEQRKSRRMLLYKLLPAVAAAVVVIVGAMVFKDKLTIVSTWQLKYYMSILCINLNL